MHYIFNETVTLNQKARRKEETEVRKFPSYTPTAMPQHQPDG